MQAQKSNQILDKYPLPPTSNFDNGGLRINPRTIRENKTSQLMDKHVIKHSRKGSSQIPASIHKDTPQSNEVLEPNLALPGLGAHIPTITQLSARKDASGIAGSNF